MNKNKLITFILNDISELDMLTKCMESMETIPYAMHDLALQKVRNILSEFEQLSVESKEEAQNNEVKAAYAEPVKVVSPVEEPIAGRVAQTCVTQSKDICESPVANVCETKIERVVSSKVEKEVIAEKVQTVQEQNVSVNKELASPKEIATKEVDVAAIDTVRVVVKEPESKIVEEISISASRPEVQKEVAKTVETEVSAPTKGVEKKISEQPKSTISNPVITNERFKGGRRLESRFVTDLRKALNFNDRFRYQRELFGGDMALLNTTVDKLNAMSSLQEAEAYVAENFNWDTTEGAAFDFMELLEARFTN